MRMPADHLNISSHRRRLWRIILWVTVALYTAALPYVILVFSAINRHFSPQIAANVPLFIIMLLAVLYVILCVNQKSVAQCVIILAISVLIVFLIMKFENNTNKYIHIPEYVLMTWLLYLALALDYRGRGILLLIFICAAMLGIVDELLQGIHLQRTYGWKDMVIDAASSLIGILTIFSLKCLPAGGWVWLCRLKYLKVYLFIILFGALTATPMCIYLFDIQLQGSFWDVYPLWLFALNGIFATTAVASVVFFWNNRQRSGRFKIEADQGLSSDHPTASLWVMCPLAILICMHGLVMWVGIAGLKFN